ncbi:MAG: ATP-binding protein [Planctomycetaceae bacterium]
MTTTDRPGTSQNTDVLHRAIERERKARRIAEQLLEDRSRELFLATEEIQAQYASLQQTQGQLIHSEKMASVGQLAAGVAHEINNPIGFVTSNVQTLTDYVEVYHTLLKDYAALVRAHESGDAAQQAELKQRITRLETDEDISYITEDTCELLHESYEGLQRVREIVQNLKSFVHLDKTSQQLANVNDGIEATLKVVWNELKYKCDVRKQLGDLPMIPCFVGELNQVFLNLLVNAAQAMEQHGVITITTGVELDQIAVRISDTGKGISREHLSQLFNPFFTTKPVGQGTGLGLSVSYGIIQKHGGTIDVDSTVGEGTTFTVRLPIRGTEPRREAALPAATTACPAG